jgi:hypothetical protein
MKISTTGDAGPPKPAGQTLAVTGRGVVRSWSETGGTLNDKKRRMGTAGANPCPGIHVRPWAGKNFPRTLEAAGAAGFSAVAVPMALADEIATTDGGSARPGEYEVAARFLEAHGFRSYTRSRIQRLFLVGRWLRDAPPGSAFSRGLQAEEWPLEWLIEAKSAARGDYDQAAALLATATKKRDFRDGHDEDVRRPEPGKKGPLPGRRDGGKSTPLRDSVPAPREELRTIEEIPAEMIQGVIPGVTAGNAKTDDKEAATQNGTVIFSLPDYLRDVMNTIDAFTAKVPGAEADAVADELSECGWKLLDLAREIRQRQLVEPAAKQGS